jgi:hypothetical protein
MEYLDKVTILALVKTIPTHALFIKTLMVLKIKPYICFGQQTGPLRGPRSSLEAGKSGGLEFLKH